MAVTVAGSLPVLHFGNVENALVATVGINPSKEEFPASTDQRFATLKSLGLNQREEIEQAHALIAINRMTNYFVDGCCYERWFRPYKYFLSGFGTSYEDGSATHLDLMQEATDPTWSKWQSQAPLDSTQLMNRDLAFLKWQLDHYQFPYVIGVTRMVSDALLRILSPSSVETIVVPTANPKFKAWGCVAKTSSSVLRLGGWNIPFARPTGLNHNSLADFGSQLRRHLDCLA